MDGRKWKVKGVQAGTLAAKLAARDATSKLYGVARTGRFIAAQTYLARAEWVIGGIGQ
jgi:hypothetical protein